MIYEIIANVDRPEELHIVVKLSENTYKSFPAENENPSYISFLRQLSEENPEDPHYLEWLEAGNNPEDFWTQDQDLVEPTEPTKKK